MNHLPVPSILKGYVSFHGGTPPKTKMTADEGSQVLYAGLVGTCLLLSGS